MWWAHDVLAELQMAQERKRRVAEGLSSQRGRAMASEARATRGSTTRRRIQTGPALCKQATCGTDTLRSDTHVIERADGGAKRVISIECVRRER